MRKLSALSIALILGSMLGSFAAHALPLEVNRRDLKLPSQAMIERQTFTTPIVATTNRIKTTYAGPASTAAHTLTSFTAQPDVPRNITITPTGTTGDVEACVITVSGTNIFGASISETFTFVADASTVQTGNKAFASVTSVAWPANCESGGFAATWIIGVGSKLGLKRCMANAGDGVFSVFNGAYETTRGTWAVDADEVEKNTFIPNGTMDGAKDVIAHFIQNFGCFP